VSWVDHTFYCTCPECKDAGRWGFGHWGAARYLIHTLTRRGVSFRLVDGKVRYRPKGLLTDEERTEIRRVRDEVYQLLREDEERRARGEGQVRDVAEVFDIAKPFTDPPSDDPAKTAWKEGDTEWKYTSARYQKERERLKHEVEIVWEEDPSNFDYVREWVDTYPNRRRIKKWTMDGRRVGYSVVAPDAPSGRDGHRGFYRREFFLKKHDRDSDPGGCYEVSCPIEGVDPRTVRPGVPGEQNERAWGAPLSA
jgi:hypothetical protein